METWKYTKMINLNVFVGQLCWLVRRPLSGVLDTVGRLPSYHVEIGEGGVAAGTEKGYPEPFVLLEPPAQNAGCSCVFSHRMPPSSGPPPHTLKPLGPSPGPSMHPGWTAFYEAARSKVLAQSPLNPPWTRIRLDPASTARKLVLLLTVLDLCLFLCRVRGHPSIHSGRVANTCTHQILKMKGFSPADFDSKKQAKLVEHLLKESETFCGHARQTLVTHTSSCSSRESQELTF